jgi:hypothetical protein
MMQNVCLTDAYHTIRLLYSCAMAVFTAAMCSDTPALHYSVKDSIKSTSTVNVLKYSRTCEIKTLQLIRTTTDFALVVKP